MNSLTSLKSGSHTLDCNKKTKFPKVIRKYIIDFPILVKFNQSMLTKSDLKQIGTIVEKSETRIKKDLGAKITKIQKDVAYTRNFLDKRDIINEKRIARIEEHLGFTEN